ncbi:MAG: hypothetical protein ACKPA8_08200 [Dolichospermum sp.]
MSINSWRNSFPVIVILLVVSGQWSVVSGQLLVVGCWLLVVSGEKYFSTLLLVASFLVLFRFYI